MSSKDNSPLDQNLPEFFQPSLSKESNGEMPGEPDWLVDLFYLRNSDNEPAHLAALAGTTGGHLTLMMGQEIDNLSPALKSGINDFQVSYRRKLRAITARELTLYALYGVEQNVQTKGFNDALYLHTRLEVSAASDGGRFHVASRVHEGWLTVGRLDMLFACMRCFDYAFRLPNEDGKTILSLMVPTTPTPTLQAGGGVGIVYPMTDTRGLRAAGNTAIVMRIIYDVLTRLQKDMSEEGINQPFTDDMTIPVPNRRRIEMELQSDGYQIQGNEAVRYRSAENSGKVSMLEHLRRLLPALWTSDRIQLPPEATARDYAQLIHFALETSANTVDVEAFQRMSRWVTGEIIPGQPVPASKPPASRATTPVQPASRPTPPAAPVKSPGKRPADWSADFGEPIAKPKRTVDSSSWSEDFGIPPENERIVLDRSDWQADFDDDSNSI